MVAAWTAAGYSAGGRGGEGCDPARIRKAGAKPNLLLGIQTIDLLATSLPLKSTKGPVRENVQRATCGVLAVFSRTHPLVSWLAATVQGASFVGNIVVINPSTDCPKMLDRMPTPAGGRCASTATGRHGGLGEEE
jgi:hypothetical protein